MFLGKDGSKHYIAERNDQSRREKNLKLILFSCKNSYVLNQILSSDNKDREQVVDNIHSYLRTVGEETRKGLIPIDKFIVNKGLTKAPEDYSDAKSQPHVQVALRMKSKGLSVRAGDTVPYIICILGDGSSNKGGYADRAYHPDEIKQPGSNLTIGMCHGTMILDFFLFEKTVH